MVPRPRWPSLARGWRRGRIWHAVRVLSAPPGSPMRTDVFRSLTNSAQFAGIFADSNVGRAVSAAGRGRDSVDFASRSLGSPNPFLAPRPKLHVKIRDDR